MLTVKQCNRKTSNNESKEYTRNQTYRLSTTRQEDEGLQSPELMAQLTLGPDTTRHSLFVHDLFGINRLKYELYDACQIFDPYKWATCKIAIFEFSLD